MLLISAPEHGKYPNNKGDYDHYRQDTDDCACFKDIADHGAAVQQQYA